MVALTQTIILLVMLVTFIAAITMWIITHDPNLGILAVLLAIVSNNMESKH